jgi:Domain of unknown function (DUF4034)
VLFGGKRFGAALLALGLWLASAPTQADEPSERIVEVRGDIELMLMEGRSNELDAIADDYRSSRVRISGGWWALAELYEQLTPFAGFRCGCGEPEISRVTFDHKRKALEAWLERRPHSLTARIALANLWKARAWQLRGFGSAKDTTAAAWRGFREAMAQAEETLAPVDETADPMVYFLEMEMVVVADDPRKRLQSMYAHATTTFPTFPAYAPQYYNYMLERWFGQRGEAAAFAASLLANPGGDDGKIDYVVVATKAATASAGVDDVMRWSGIDYNALIDAYAARQRTVGLNNRDWNVLLFYSVAVRDKKGANFALKHVAGDWDRGVFNQPLIDWITGWSQSWL